MTNQREFPAHLPRLLLPAVVALWLIPRFLGAPPAASPVATRTLDGVHAGASAETGRLTIWGLPDQDTDPAGLLSLPAIAAGRTQLLDKLAGANEALALRAAEITRRLQDDPNSDAVGLRLGGWIIPFYGRDATALRALGGTAAGRPVEALNELASVLETHLERPPTLDDVDDASRRRELALLSGDLRDAVRTRERLVDEAVEAFRSEATEAVAVAAGPFRRRGRGRLWEMLLAALLGATLHAALRRPGAPQTWTLPLSFAPVLALGVLLPLEGSSVLPVTALHGTSAAFVPFAFALGFGSRGILHILARLDRLFGADGATARADTRASEVREPPETLPRSAAAPRVKSPRVRDEPPKVPRTDPSPTPVGPDGPDDSWKAPPNHEAVRSLARQILEGDPAETPPGREPAVSAHHRADSLRSEREVPEDPGVHRRPDPTERLPFFRRRS